MREWALQDAKARLSELIRLAMADGPQEITLRGEPAVVVMSRAEYDRMAQKKKRFVDLIRRSPLVDTDIELDRETSLTRDIEW